MAAIFLHGGGDDPRGRAISLNPFVDQVMTAREGPLAMVVAETDEDAAGESFSAYRTILKALGVPAGRLQPLFVTPEAPLTRAKLAAATPAGLFVCGGLTPNYHAALSAEPDWVSYLAEAAIAYAGTSAGAAVAAAKAIVGGWRAEREGELRPILFQGAGEGLDRLTVRQGLGLVPFAVEVHASQWGTFSRLVHAVTLGLVDEGWAIDENTTLQVENGELRLYGLGQAYHVGRGEEGAAIVSIHAAPPEPTRLYTFR
jgi:cyanophycinase